MIYHSGKFQIQEEGVSIEEIIFFKQAIKEIIDKRRDKYNSENLQYIGIIENLLKETGKREYFESKIQWESI